MNKQPSQNERILRVLADGAWHTTSEIHRRAGTSRLNSRISELRKKGALIQSARIPNRTGPRAWRYQWQNVPPAVSLQLQQAKTPPKNEVPRTPATRYRIYRVARFGEQELVGTAPTPEALGVRLVALAQEGEFRGACIGVLDSKGISNDIEPGAWLVNPHEGRW